MPVKLIALYKLLPISLLPSFDSFILNYSMKKKISTACIEGTYKMIKPRDR